MLDLSFQVKYLWMMFFKGYVLSYNPRTEGENICMKRQVNMGLLKDFIRNEKKRLLSRFFKYVAQATIASLSFFMAFFSS